MSSQWFTLFSAFILKTVMQKDEIESFPTTNCLIMQHFIEIRRLKPMHQIVKNAIQFIDPNSVVNISDIGFQ